MSKSKDQFYKPTEENFVTRLIRLESKLVRGFEEIGVSLDVKKDWLTVENNSNTVYVSTIGRSLTVILQEMKARGANKHGEFYEVVHRGDVVAHVLFTPRF
jgi:hypothetical protein